MSIKDHLVALNTFLLHASYHVARAGPCFGKEAHGLLYKNPK